MASKNSIKVDVENSYYHIYNRGVEKRNIFIDTQDKKVFLNYLKEYLSPPVNTKDIVREFTVKDTVFKGIARQPKNYHQKIDFVSYCLMPNHFHFLLKQIEKTFMKQFMHSLQLRYSNYFNKKYDRIGPLFQGRYKAILVDKDEYLLHLSRYIHLNPSENTNDLTKTYSSYAEYLGLRKTKWINPQIILSFFNQATFPELKKTNSYQAFVEKYKKNSAKLLGDLTIE